MPSVEIFNACTLNELVNVQGSLAGSKGIPITGYTVDVYLPNGSSLRIATNVVSNGGDFDFTGKTPDCSSIPIPSTVRVTTNRQVYAEKEVTSQCKITY